MAKHADTLEHEILAYHLAEHLGLSTPFLRVESRLPKSARDLLGSGARPVMLMRRISGLSFSELEDEDANRLRDSIGHPNSLLREIGRVAAFDYLLQNEDRFPIKGLGGHNTGNLMLSSRGVQAIDHTLPRLIAEPETRRYRKLLATVLNLMHDPHDDEALACLRGIVAFFPQERGLDWSSIRDDVVAGFAEQARRIGQMHNSELRRVFQLTGKDKALKHEVKDLLLGHLAVFQEAALSAT